MGCRVWAFHIQRAVACCYTAASVQAHVSPRSVRCVFVVQQTVLGRTPRRGFLDRAGDVCSSARVRQRAKKKRSSLLVSVFVPLQ